MSRDKELNETPHGEQLVEAKARVREKVAALYSAMAPQAELSSKATFSLLASFTLIGVSIADTKPQTAQVLGFTFQADHWLLLAFPLAVAVVYSIALLLLAWKVEVRRYKYVVVPIQLDLFSELGPILDAHMEKLRDNMARTQQDFAFASSDVQEEYSKMESNIAQREAEEAKIKERVQQEEVDLTLAYTAGSLTMEALLDGMDRGREELRKIRERSWQLQSDELSRISAGSKQRLGEIEKAQKKFEDRRVAEIGYWNEVIREAGLASKLSKHMTSLGLSIPVLLAVGACVLLAVKAF